MDILSFDQNDFKKLSFIGGGIEGNIFKFNDLALKVFHSKIMSESKYNKIKLINNYNIQNYITSPTNIIKIDNVLKGYAMKNYKDYITLKKLLDIPNEKKLIILNKIKLILEFFHNKTNIIVGDLNFGNIMINNNDVIFCDIDNFTIGDIKSEMFNIYGKMYLKENKEITSNLDVFEFNIMTFLYLFNISEAELMDYINCINLYPNKELKPIITEILKNDYFKNHYYIDEVNKDTELKKKLIFKY